MEERYQCIERFFKYVNNCDTIVYTNDHELDKYKTERIKLIYTEISELYAYKYSNYFEWALKNLTTNSEIRRRQTTIDHLIIWNSKIDLLVQSLNDDYDGFMFIDIGSFRQNLNISSFPHITDKLLNKIHLNFYGALEYINRNNYDTIIANYIYCCDKNKIIKLHAIFYNILEQISKNKIILFDRPAEESILNIGIKHMKNDIILTNETEWWPFIKWYSK